MVPDGAYICLGFDGSENNDWSAIRAETADGHVFTPTYGPRQPARPSGTRAPSPAATSTASEVAAAVDEIFSRYNVGRFYCDPQDWRSEIGEWALKYGDKVVMEWPTNQISRMYAALSRFEVDLGSGRVTHDDDHDRRHPRRQRPQEGPDGAALHPHQACRPPEDRRGDVHRPRPRGDPGRPR